MNKKIVLNALWVVPVVLFAALSLNSIVAQSASAPAFSWAYPNPATSAPLAYPNPSVSPTPSILPPPKPSEAAQKALEYTDVVGSQWQGRK